MKRTVIFSFLMACAGVLLGGSPNSGSSSRKPATLLDDLVRLTRAGASDVSVLAYAKAHRLELPPEVSDSDLRWLRDSGVSDAVVRYMMAIDVRASDEGAQLDVGSYADRSHPSAAYSYSRSSDDDNYGGNSSDRYAGSYPDTDYDTYAGYEDYPSYGYGYYPSYGYGYSPYPVYFFVDRHGFSHRFPGRDHRGDGHRGFDGGRGFRGHRGDVVGPGGSRDAWRERGFSQYRGGSSVVGPRGSRYPALARGAGSGFQGPHGRAIGPRGFGPSGAARGISPQVSRGPRGSVSGHGGFSRPGFSGGPHTGGGFARSSHAAAGPSGGRRR